MSDEALAQIMSAINSLSDRIGNLESGMLSMRAEIRDIREELRDVKGHIKNFSQSNVQILTTLDKQKRQIDDINQDLAAAEVDLGRTIRQQRRMNQRLSRVELAE